MGTGQCNVKAYNRVLMNLIHHDKAQPSMIISHELPLDEEPTAYKHFDSRDDGWTKWYCIRNPFNPTKDNPMHSAGTVDRNRYS